MPKYQVDTDRGAFIVELDKAPESQEQLLSLVQQELGKRPLLPPTQVRGAMQSPGELASEAIGGFAKKAAIPVAAGVGAALTGGALGVGAAGMAGLEALFGAGGEALNQALGITEPSLPQLGLAAAAGPAARAVGGVARATKAGIARRLPGASTTLHEMASESAEQMGKRLLPGIPSDDLFALSRQMGNPTIATPKLKAAAEELLRVESKLPGFDISALKRQARGLLKEIEAGGGQLDLETINLLRQRIGPLTKSMQNVPKDVAARSETQLLAGLFDDLDDAVKTMGTIAPTKKGFVRLYRGESTQPVFSSTTPSRWFSPNKDVAEFYSKFHGAKTGSPIIKYVDVPEIYYNELLEESRLAGIAQPSPVFVSEEISKKAQVISQAGSSAAANLKMAIEAARKESASKQLSRLLSPEGGGINIRPADGTVIVKPGKILQELETNKSIQRFADPAVLAEIKKEVQVWAKQLRAAPPIRGQQRGAGLMAGRAAVGFAGGLAFGDPGSGAAIMMLAPEIIAAGLQTSAGRFVLRRALAEKGFLDHGNLSMLMQIVRAGFAEPGETLQVMRPGATPQ